jgi:hypothetical protein
MLRRRSDDPRRGRPRDGDVRATSVRSTQGSEEATQRLD